MARPSHAVTGYRTHGPIEWAKFAILEYGQFGSSGHPALAHLSYHPWRRQYTVCPDNDVLRIIQCWQVRVGIVAVT